MDSCIGLPNFHEHIIVDQSVYYEGIFECSRSLGRHSNGNKSVLKWSQNSAHVSDDSISTGIRLPQKGQRGQVFDRVPSLARRIFCIFFVLYCLFSVLCVLSL